MAIIDLNEISNFLKKFKYGLYGVSLILFVSGLFIFYSSFKVLHDSLIELTSTDKTFIYICFVISTLLLLISFLGSSESFENPFYVKAYVYSILLCLILQVTVFIQVLKIDSDEMSTEIKENYIYKYYRSSEKAKQLIDTLQSTNKCCGIDNYSDYNVEVTDLPRSCCKPSDDTFCYYKSVYVTGCRISIKQTVMMKKTLFFGVLSSSFFIQLLTIIFTISLSKDSTNQSNIE